MSDIHVSHETETSSMQKEKRRKWVFGRLKKKRLPSIAGPPPPTSKETTILSEAEEEQSKHALTVAIASAAAAEAAVTAAQVAAQVVRLTGVPQSSQQCKEKSEVSQTAKTRNGAPQSTYQCQRDIKELAAIKIQTAFKGYLVSLSKLFFFGLYLRFSLHNLLPLLLSFSMMDSG